MKSPSTPAARDRVLAARYGLKAADLVEEGRFGRMAALHGDSIVDVALGEATAELETVPPRGWYDAANAFFGLCGVSKRLTRGPVP